MNHLSTVFIYRNIPSCTVFRNRCYHLSSFWKIQGNKQLNFFLRVNVNVGFINGYTGIAKICLLQLFLRVCNLENYGADYHQNN
jgi:hypothetical protein